MFSNFSDTNFTYSTTELTGQAYGINKPCSAYSNSKKNWCSTFKGNFSDVWYLSWVLTMISFGTMFLRYPLYAAYIRGLQQTRFNKNENNVLTKYGKILDNENETIQMVKRGNIGGWTLDQFNIFNAINILLLIIAKCLLANDNSYFVNDANKAFRHGFRKFCNANVIIIGYIFSISTISSIQSIRLLRIENKIKESISIVSKLTNVVCISDIIITIFILCFNWSYLVLSLYVTAITLLIGFMLAASLCFWIPCFGLYSVCLGCIARLLACNRDTNFAKVLLQIGGGVVFYTFTYFYTCFIILWIWIFNQKSPKTVVIYKDTNNQNAITIMIFTSCLWGLLILIVGVVKSLLIRQDYMYHSGDYSTFETEDELV